MNSSRASLEGYLENESAHERQWQELSTQFLPLSVKGSIWRYSRERVGSDPNQGWKLHLSANILTANQTLSTVGPYLTRNKVLFKAPCSLQELQNVNSGLKFGYTQVGKFITIYPQSDSEAKSLATRLHELTQGLNGPSVPYDSRYRRESNLYYRYGAFGDQTVLALDGKPIPAIKDNEGKLIADDYICPAPSWVKNPFVEIPERETPPKVDLSSLNYRVIQAYSQRGKGGVYLAVDFNVDPPCRCVIKQARIGGEVQWDGSDATSFLDREAHVLECLNTAGVPVPRIYSKFKLNNDHFLVMESIDGVSLRKLLDTRTRRFSIASISKMGANLCRLLKLIHDAGFIWRDCKPSNLVLTPAGSLRPVDFEGAADIKNPSPILWQTPGYLPSTDNFEIDGPLAKDDAYSVGVICYFLLTGRMPEGDVPIPIAALRKKVPRGLRELVVSLMAPRSDDRPGVVEALAVFGSI